MLFGEFGETGKRILLTAESLFAEYGFDGVSLRQITVKAGVNLAAVNYHYSDKKSLCRELLAYRLREINQVRLDELGQAEARAGGSPVALQEIIEIMARPLFLPGSELAAYNPSTRRLLGRVFVEPLPFMADILATELQPTMTRFGQAIRRHAPSLSPPDFLWRFSLVVGAMHHALATMHEMKKLTNGICRNDDGEAAFKNFTEFALKSFQNW
jgi:AcrR family transcriptional regulator